MADINKIFLKKQRDTNVSDYVGSQGEIFYDTTQRVLKISDGVIKGGQHLSQIGNLYAANNRIGIGDDNPTVIVSIKDASPKIKFIDSDATGTPETLLDGSGGDLILDIDKDNEKNSTLFAVKIDGDEKLILNSDGKLLIGTSAEWGSDVKLHLANSGNTYLTLTSGTSSNGVLAFSDDGTERGAIDYDHNGDHMLFKTSAAERLCITGGGLVGIATTNPSEKLQVDGNAIVTGMILSGDGTTSNCAYANNGDNNTGIFFPAADRLGLVTGGTNRLTIDDNGLIANGEILPVNYGSPNLLISGTDSTLTMMGNGAVNNTSFTGIKFRVAGGSTGDYTKAGIFSRRESGYNDLSLIFAINSDANDTSVSISDEILRIASNGYILTNGNTSLPTGTSTGFGFSQDQFYISYTGTSANYIQRFYNGNGLIGSVLASGSATAFNTSSDYRLKENEVAISDGITRLKTLKPYRFNFKTDPSKTVDGFFAHEVTAVPEAIAGEKDGTEMQGIDQSKLVPLLTAALQEAITKIETLETKVAALEGS